jgi:hypothetical protein
MQCQLGEGFAFALLNLGMRIGRAAAQSAQGEAVQVF